MKIVVFCPNWIGDLVMATPALRAVRRHFPEASITALVKPYAAAVLDQNPHIDQMLFWDTQSVKTDERGWGLVRRLRQERFDLGILLTNSLRSALLLWLGNVKRRLGYARDGRSFFLTDRLQPKKTGRSYQPSPVIDYYLQLAYRLGAAPETYQMDLYLTPEDQQAVADLWKKFGFQSRDRIVALNPGAAFGPAKRWPSHYFAELARRLVDHANVKVLVLCGPKERGFAQFIADGSRRPTNVKSLAEESVSLGLSKAIISRSELLVSTDSGPRHFAAAFGVPVVSLFGPTAIEWTETYFPAETRLRLQLPCSPCQQRTCPLKHHRCMNELTVDRVFDAVRQLLPVFDTVRRVS